MYERVILFLTAFNQDTTTSPSSWLLSRYHHRFFDQVGHENMFASSVKKHFFTKQCTEVRFVSFFSGGFTTMAVMNTPERKLSKRTSVHCLDVNLNDQKTIHFY